MLYLSHAVFLYQHQQAQSQPQDFLFVLQPICSTIFAINCTLGKVNKQTNKQIKAASQVLKVKRKQCLDIKLHQKRILLKTHRYTAAVETNNICANNSPINNNEFSSKSKVTIEG